MNAQASVEKLKAEGYTEVSIVPNDPNTEFPLHTHDKHTVHIILAGELTLKENGVEKTVKQGERIEIPKGTTHTVKCGPEGCTFVVGFKS